MKTIYDIQQHCYDEARYSTECILEKLSDSEELDIRRLSYLSGQVSAYEDIAGSIHAILKHHECKFIDNKCVLCNETAEAV